MVGPIFFSKNKLPFLSEWKNKLPFLSKWKFCQYRKMGKYDWFAGLQSWLRVTDREKLILTDIFRFISKQTECIEQHWKAYSLDWLSQTIDWSTYLIDWWTGLFQYSVINNRFTEWIDLQTDMFDIWLINKTVDNIAVKSLKNSFDWLTVLTSRYIFELSDGFDWNS